MKSLLVDNRVLLTNNVSRKQYIQWATVHLFQVLSDTVDYDEISSIKKLFEFILEFKTGLLFKTSKNRFLQRSGLIYSVISKGRYDRSSK